MNQINLSGMAMVYGGEMTKADAPQVLSALKSMGVNPLQVIEKMPMDMQVILYRQLYKDSLEQIDELNHELAELDEEMEYLKDENDNLQDTIDDANAVIDNLHEKILALCNI